MLDFSKIMSDCDVVIIGGGVIGNAVGYELSKVEGLESLFIVEMNESFPGENQTTRNSGVVHAGIYYDRKSSPLKASLCVEGNRLLYDFCEENKVDCRQTGKIVVATNGLEDKVLEELLVRAKENEVSGVRIIGSAEAKELEPNVRCTSALYVPTSGIVDPAGLVKALKGKSKSDLLLGTRVLGIGKKGDEFVVRVSSNGQDYEFSTNHVVNAAGLYSDEVARMVNPDFPLRVFPVRGESAIFYPTSQEVRVSRNVYPVPITYQKPDGSSHLTLGVHLTPTFGDGITIGPLNLKKGQEVGKTNFGGDLSSEEEFYKRVKEYFPNISLRQIRLHQAGIQAVLGNGADFHIQRDVKNPKMINLVGICSPGLTSSLAIAKRVRDMVD